MNTAPPLTLNPAAYSGRKDRGHLRADACLCERADGPGGSRNLQMEGQGWCLHLSSVNTLDYGRVRQLNRKKEGPVYY